MADSQEICGRFFLADNARNHYGEETLLDLLNHTSKEFIPFAQSDDGPMILIKKSAILGLQPTVPNADQWPKMSHSNDQCWPSAKITFAQQTLEGNAYTGDMPPERRRLADLLNHDHLFFIFETEAGPWVINKNLMKYLEPLK